MERCDRRNLWIHRLKIGKPVTKNMLVCSLHFVKSDYILPDLPAKHRFLKKNAIPSVNLPASSLEQRGFKKRGGEGRRNTRRESVLQNQCDDMLEEQQRHEGIHPGSQEGITQIDALGLSEAVENSEAVAVEALITLGNPLPTASKVSSGTQVVKDTKDFGCQVTSGDLKNSICDLIGSEKNSVIVFQ